MLCKQIVFTSHLAAIRLTILSEERDHECGYVYVEALLRQFSRSLRERENHLRQISCHAAYAHRPNTVRKQELSKASKRFKGPRAGKKFILLSRQCHVRGKARLASNMPLSANRHLFKAYLL